MKKVLTILAISTLLFGLAATAEDLVIQSKTQTYSEKDNKINNVEEITL